MLTFVTGSALMLGVIMLTVFYDECCYALSIIIILSNGEFNCSECHYNEFFVLSIYVNLYRGPSHILSLCCVPLC
jgi:hypothetical protein